MHQHHAVQPLSASGGQTGNRLQGLLKPAGELGGVAAGVARSAAAEAAAHRAAAHAAAHAAEAEAAAVARSAAQAVEAEAAGALSWAEPVKLGAGLRNLGNTCFLAAVLQALTHTPPLAAMAKRKLHRPGCAQPGPGCPCCLLESRIHASLTAPVVPGGGAMWRPLGSVPQPAAQAPSEVHGALQRFAPSLGRFRQEDAHEALRMTLEALHQQGLRAQGQPVHGPGAAPGPHRQRTVVERVFGGTLRSRVLCRGCGGCSDCRDPVFDLSLELARGGQGAARRARRKEEHR